MTTGPMCCGAPAYLNVVSPRLQFWVCDSCKKEVLDLPSPQPEQTDEYEGWPTLSGTTMHWVQLDLFGIKED
jgi:hypothetical protein